MKDNVKILIFGFLAGLISGFFGAGGGLLLVPFFSKILKLDSKTSRATAITIILFLVLASSFFYLKNEAINWKIALFCAIRRSFRQLFWLKSFKKFKLKFFKYYFYNFFDI